MERPLACVVPKPEFKGQLAKQEILDYLTPRVAKWWLPDDVRFIDAVPKTSVGKFDKKVLREKLQGLDAGGLSRPRALGLSPPLRRRLALRGLRRGSPAPRSPSTRRDAPRATRARTFP